MEHASELEDRVRRLSTELDDMRARMAKLESANGGGKAVSPRSDRRGFLKLGAGAVMGALGWAAVKVVPAAAATGGYMVLGSTNQANASTRLQAQTNDIYPVFSAQSLNFSQAALDATGEAFAGSLQVLGDGTGIIEGVDGWAGGAQAFGVYGLTDAGVGVTGEANTGVGLYARGTGRLLQDGFVTPGTGQAPSFVGMQFEQVRDTDGVLWVCDAAGAWRRVNTPRADSDDGAGTAYKPFRAVDTRGSTGGYQGPHGTGTNHTFQIAGTGTGKQHIPTSAVAIFGNLTVTSFTGNGWLTITPAGVAHAGSDPSTVNFAAGMAPAIANGFFCGLGTGGNAGKVTVYVNVSSGSSINYILDITGYVQ